MSTLITNTLQGINTIKYDANTTAMTIDSSGNAAFNQRVTKPNQISYCVRGTTGAQTFTSGALTIYAPSPDSSNNGFHNIGGHFDPSNGKFTAPIAGRYLIHCSWTNWWGSSFNASDGWQVRMRVNGVTAHDFFHAGGTGSGYEARANATAILNLSASDYVDFQMTGYTGDSTIQQQLFYGYLLG